MTVPRKRVKLGNRPAETAAPSLSIPPLLASLDRFIQLTTAPSQPTLADLEGAVTTLDSCLGSLTSALAQVGVNELDDAQKDDLDQRASTLWNWQNSHVSAGSQEGDNQRCRQAIAQLKLLLLRIIRITSASQLSIEETILLLNLTASTALTHLAIGNRSIALNLTTEAATLADDLSDFKGFDSILRSNAITALLSYHVCRIRTLIDTESYAVAEWLRKKVEDLLKIDDYPSRQLEMVLHASYDLAKELLSKSEEARETGKRSEAAISWIDWAMEIVRRGQGPSFAAMELALLKTVTFALLSSDSDSDSARAEESLRNLIAIEPTFERKRHLCKLILTRGGSDEELLEAYSKFVPDLIEKEENGLSVISDIYHLPPERRQLRFNLLQSLLAEVSTRYDPPSLDSGRLIDQSISAAALLIKFEDLPRIVMLVDIAAGVNHVLASHAAFLVAMYIETVVRAHEDTNKLESARWLALLSSPVFGSLDYATRSKSIRKAVLLLIDVEEFQQADELLQSIVSIESNSSDDLLKFFSALHQGDSQAALGSLAELCSSSTFKPDHLVWAAQQAIEIGNQDVVGGVLVKIVEVGRARGRVEGIDLFTASRLLLRMLFTKLDGQSDQREEVVVSSVCEGLQAAAEIARGNIDSQNVSESLKDGLAWIRHNALKTGSANSKTWSEESLSRVYDSIANLTEIEASIASSPAIEVLSTLWSCRLARIAIVAKKARVLPPNEQRTIYKSVLDQSVDLQSSVLAQRNDHSAKVESDRILNAAASLRVEAGLALNDWQGLLSIVEFYEEDEIDDEAILILRTIADKVSTSTRCPYDIVRSIYRKILAMLYQQEKLDSVQLAIWIRLMITFFMLHEHDEAFKYFENAQQLIRRNSEEYPADEFSWLISTAWDHGIDSYGSKAIDEGSKWCGMARDLARLTDSNLANQLEEWLKELESQFSQMSE